MRVQISKNPKHGENPSDYGYALKRLGCLAFPNMTYDDREINVLEQFITGIGNSAIHDHVIFHHPTTLKAAISLAIEFESVKGPQLSVSKPNYASDTVNVVTNKSEKQTPKQEPLMAELMKLMQSCERNSPKSKLIEGGKDRIKTQHQLNAIIVTRKDTLQNTDRIE